MGAFVLPLFVGCAPVGDKSSEAPAPSVVAGDLPSARLAPVLAVGARSPVRGPVALTNPTKDELTYAVDAGGSGLYHLQGIPYRDGQMVGTGRVMHDQPPFQKHQVRRLKPGAAVALRYRLPYSKVEPGRYELRLIHEIHPKSVNETEHGLTAMKLEQMILLDIRDE